MKGCQFFWHKLKENIMLRVYRIKLDDLLRCFKEGKKSKVMQWQASKTRRKNYTDMNYI